MANEAVAVLLPIVVILVAARIGSELARRARLPGVVGEIVAGILLGPSVIRFLDVTSENAAAIPATEVLLFLGELGVLLLLFEVGLESDLGQLRRVGASASLVGTLGVVVSLAAGAAVSFGLANFDAWIDTDAAVQTPVYLHLFVGAILTATSVGITARVLSEMGRIQTIESQVILGAAVVDDVLGLVVLAIMGGLVAGGLTAIGIGVVVVKAIGFFIVGLAAASWAFPRFLRGLHKVFKADFVHFGFAVIFMLMLAYAAAAAGLAPIVGAFVAGIAFSRSEHRHEIFDQVRPMGSLFTGFFFVLLGAHVDLTQFPVEQMTVALVAIIVLTVSGVAAKLGAGLGVLRGQADRLTVGVGMVPRGEVGFIFALAALQFGVLANWQYTILIVVILLTTLVAPPWLKALRNRFQPSEVAPIQARLEDAV